MKAAASVYTSVGRALLAGISGPASPFITVTPAEFIAGSFDFKGFGPTKVRMALALARLRQKKGAERIQWHLPPMDLRMSVVRSLSAESFENCRRANDAEPFSRADLREKPRRPLTSTLGSWHEIDLRGRT